MAESLPVWLVLVVAVLAANLPFVNDRLLAAIPLRRRKPLPLRLAELVAMYFVTGGVGLLFEQRAGQIAPQGWEFYAITGALFITLAFPGFIFRYLWKRRHHD